MKRTLIISVALLCAHQLPAAEINSGVIHNYKYIGLGYGYLHDVAGSIDAHGGLAEISYDAENLLIAASGGYFLTESGGIDIWSVAGTLGYILRPAENRVNVIPRIGIGYTEASGGGVSGDTTALLPGVTVSFALNDRVSVNGGYTYAYDLDTEADAHGFGVGTRIAVAEKIGLNLGANFAEGNGFTGASAALTFHF